MRGIKLRVEWPTMALAGLVYGGWLLATWHHAAMPAWAFAAIMAWLVAWHSSFQHEVIHGHPTGSRAINRALGFPPLLLWLPFERYRAIHLRHHRDERLTDPLDDPESRYLSPEAWARMGPLRRALVTAQTVLPGRLLIGPLWSVPRFLAAEARGLAADEPGLRLLWARHAAGIVAIGLWLELACGLPLWRYLLLAAYPATALLMVRSFAEHRAEAEPARRTAIVEDWGPLGLLFLYNNLHAAHHARPSLAWYRLPAYYRQHRQDLLAANGGLLYRGYEDVLRRFWRRPHDTPVHPQGRAPGHAEPERAHGSAGASLPVAAFAAPAD